MNYLIKYYDKPLALFNEKDDAVKYIKTCFFITKDTHAGITLVDLRYTMIIYSFDELVNIE